MRPFTEWNLEWSVFVFCKFCTYYIQTWPNMDSISPRQGHLPTGRTPWKSKPAAYNSHSSTPTKAGGWLNLWGNKKSLMLQGRLYSWGCDSKTQFGHGRHMLSSRHSQLINYPEVDSEPTWIHSDIMFCFVPLHQFARSCGEAYIGRINQTFTMDIRTYTQVASQTHVIEHNWQLFRSWLRAFSCETSADNQAHSGFHFIHLTFVAQ